VVRFESVLKGQGFSRAVSIVFSLRLFRSEKLKFRIASQVSYQGIALAMP
jgi:hypothetical protein